MGFLKKILIFNIYIFVFLFFLTHQDVVYADNSSVTSTTTQPFLKNLQFNEQHEDVKRLQQFLNNNGFVIASSGIGSLGKESNKYGLKTLTAVKRFQEANRISILNPLKIKNGTGVFSSSTRNFINSLIKEKNKLISATAYRGLNFNPVTKQSVAQNVTPITSVAGISGVSNYTLGGSISGLFGSVTLYVDRLLSSGNGQTLTLNRDGQFTFDSGISGGSSYSVSVKNNPINPAQNCTVLNAAGVIVSNTSNLQVTCAASVTPVLNISVSSAGVYEDSDTNLVYTVSLSEAVATTTNINLSVTGTATSSSDYSGIVSMLTIPAGQATGTITINPTPDSVVENNEIVKVRIKAGDGYTLGLNSSSSASILDDDNTASTGTTMFIKQQGSDYVYSYDNTSWTTFSWPFNIQNLSLGTLTVKFVSDMTISDTNGSFIVGNDNISFEGAAYNASGKPTTITIQDVINYPGLIQNGTSLMDGNNNISIRNIMVNSSNSSLYPANGWIGQSFFSKNATGNSISYCGTNGTIPTLGGGIVGASADNLSISNCYSTGNILNFGGGIIGAYSNSAIITKSYTSGSISSDAGGIVGNSAVSPVVVKSYTTGNISNRAGGIIGSDSSSSLVTNSYSMGFINSNAGGIIGSSSVSPLVSNSYTAGVNLGVTGGIIAGSSSDGATNYSEANNLGSSWSDAHANSVLIIGSDWISINANMPYLLSGTTHSAYSVAHENSFSQTIDIGDHTVGAADYYTSSCTILTINGSNPSVYPNITIEETTGTISTTQNVDAGDYEIVTYCINSELQYSISSFSLSVI